MAADQPAKVDSYTPQERCLSPILLPERRVNIRIRLLGLTVVDGWAIPAHAPVVHVDACVPEDIWLTVYSAANVPYIPSWGFGVHPAPSVSSLISPDRPRLIIFSTEIPTVNLLPRHYDSPVAPFSPVIVSPAVAPDSRLSGRATGFLISDLKRARWVLWVIRA